MATITSAGLGSGLDINSIISKLMQVESQPFTAMATKEASFQAKLSAFGSLKGALSTLQTTAQTLKTTTTFTGMSASSSDSSVLSVSGSSIAVAGTHSISVTQLAKFQAVRSNNNYAAATDTFNTGSLAIQIGSGAAVNVTIGSSNNTLAGIRDAINAANAGVTANIVLADDGVGGSTYRLALTSKTSGSSGAITITGTDTLPLSGGMHSLDDFDFSGTETATMKVTQAADDAKLTVGGIEITRSSNTISDAITGLTLNLLKGTATTPGTATVTVAKNTGAVSSAVSAFVKAYNDAVSGIKTMTAYDAANKKASVLTGDSTARSIQSQLSALVGTSVSGIAGGISRLSDIGISVQKDGTLALDSSKLSTALADTSKDVNSLFTQTTSGNEGIAVRINKMLEGIVGSAGMITSRTDGISASIKDIQKRGEALQNRLVQVEKRYRAQFTALDSLIASMNQTSTYLTQQLANLPGASSK
jgi:flagellar hook-associated protein 2